ncbi:helix-turn-helix domain-containing protein [Cohnella pontilimi]|uniref:Helix-turn-helix domain-containing protein n=1 Tax=Cohnella pontilimi TaxID=2564100 RepID=A0A4U0FGR7_9BACL|nr:helix-turn-helix domain-containing protein [Cohnella pontilimi]TJY44127.1 helix-turn-helix domain-containing protein [Cohnella pontilimi]
MKLTGNMKALSTWRAKTPPSLFIWLLTCFLAIVLLLTSFLLYSLFFFRGHIKEEIIRYNEVNLKNTTGSYEHQLELIKNAVLTFSMIDRLSKLDNPDFDYAEAHLLMEDIDNLVVNPSLYLNNLIIHFETNGMMLERSRGSDAEKMIARYLNSPGYPDGFRKSELDQPPHLRVLPSSEFAEVDYNNRRSNSKQLMPVIIKNHNHPSVSLIAMADTEKMYQAFHRSINDNFYILDAAGRQLYDNKSMDSVTFPAFSDVQGYVKQGKYYFFYKKGEISGLTYVNIIQDDNIASQMKWNVTFVVLLILSILIAVAASFMFSVKLNKPVRKIVDSIARLQFSVPDRSHIKEYKLIQEKIEHILQTNRDISHNLQINHSLLRHYAYITKLKKIRGNVNFLSDLIDANKPYRFVLFQLTFKPGQLEEIEVDEERAASYISEYINQVMSEYCPSSLTFQMENDQILSVVYEEQPQRSLLDALKEIGHVLKLDYAYCFVTMAVGCRREAQEAFDLSYHQVKDLLLCRKFDDDVQLLFQNETKPAHIHFLLPVQEEEIDLGFRNGNEAHLLQIVKKELADLKKKAATEFEVRSFVGGLMLKAKKAYMLHRLDGDSLDVAHDLLKHCYTFEELESLLEIWMSKLSEPIRSKKEKRDHITSFVFEYIEKHYQQDVSLDTLADKLGITRSYLSTYFKEKTGIYFVDYVNRVRINLAKELLMNTDIKIQEAAARVGYQNINSFNRMFKKFTGVTPSEYRKTELTG